MTQSIHHCTAQPQQPQHLPCAQGLLSGAELCTITVQPPTEHEQNRQNTPNKREVAVLRPLGEPADSAC
jgi:hypothetical protein